MFDLETKIADWRAQMQNAGRKKCALPTRDLEICLRAEIERQRATGFNEQVIFNFAVRKYSFADRKRS